MSSSSCCLFTCIQISQEAGQVVWYSHLFQNFPQFVVIHTVKGFHIVNKAEVDVFLELSCFFDDPTDVRNLISDSSAFSKTTLNIYKFKIHLLLKPGMENFEHYFASVWNECNCAVVWTFFGTDFLWERNGVAIILNRTVRNAVLGCNLRNDKMISVHFQGKAFNITVIQVYAPTSNAKEVEVEWFYEDLQDLLDLAPKDVFFIIGVWNAKVGSQEIPGVTGKFSPGVQNKAGQRLTEFCQENALVIANTLFQHKRRHYT